MIKLNEVSVTYKNSQGSAAIKALKPVSLKFDRGTFTVLLGPSGAGKSSLLRTLNLLEHPSSGFVHIDGLGDPSRNGNALKQHRLNTAMIFQQYQLIGRFSALKNVLLSRIGHYNALRSLLPLPLVEKQLALECLERVGLLNKALERVDKLSGGEQQRVGIARALSQKPKVLLADEPIASLDPVTSAKILSLLRKICAEDGLSAIVSLHQVEFAKDYADRIVALSNGQVVFDGTPDELTAERIAEIYAKSP